MGIMHGTVWSRYCVRSHLRYAYFLTFTTSQEEKKELDAPSFVNLSEDAEDKLDKALLAAPVLSGAFYLAGASVLHTKVIKGPNL